MTRSTWRSQQATVSDVTVGAAVRVPAECCRIITEHLDRMVCVPFLVHLPERDRLLMLVSDGAPSRPMLMSSDDHGERWSDPRPMLPPDPEARNLLGLGLTHLGGRRLAASITVFPCSTDGRYRVFSDDGGATWSAPVPIPRTSAGEVWNPWDRWLVDRVAAGDTIRVAETGSTSTHDAPHGGHSRAFVRFSTDGGVTWSDETRPAAWEGANEVHLDRAADGTLVAACRLNPPEAYWNEIDHYEGLGVSRSRDDGRTWSEIEVLPPWGRHHPSMVVLPDDRIVMSYVVRKGYPDTADGYPQFGIEAVISRDHGRTWDLQRRHVLAQWRGNTCGEDPELERQFRATWPRWWASSQATSTVLLPDGETLLTAFGTGYRSRPDSDGACSPRDIGLVTWCADGERSPP